MLIPPLGHTAFNVAATLLNYTYCNTSADPLACLRSKPLPDLYVELPYWPQEKIPPLAPAMAFGLDMPFFRRKTPREL